MYFINSIHFISIGLASVSFAYVKQFLFYMIQRCVGGLYYQRVEGYDITFYILVMARIFACFFTIHIRMCEYWKKILIREY